MADDLFSGRRERRTKQEATASETTDGPILLSQAEREKHFAMLSSERHLADLQTPSTVKLIKDTDLHFQWVITPVDGYWKDVDYVFDVTLPNNFPYSSPIVVCKTPIWHPNIDLDGKPCVSVLQKGWKPTHALNYLMFGLVFLFDHPNPEDPLNLQAAEEMRKSMDTFLKNVVIYTQKAKAMAAAQEKE
jgi:ubiquitin-conjugating enzyme E2 M